MTKLFVSLLFLLSIQTGHAQGFTEGEGSFVAEQSDNLNFVRRQLLASAFRDVVKKELTQMGLDADNFFKRLEEKYQAQHAEDFEKLKTQFGQSGEKPDPRRREDYLKAKRVRELTTKDRFENFNRLITSYTAQNITRSARNPQLRFMKIEARVDRQALNSLYLEYTRSVAQGGRTIYLSVDFDLGGLTFLDFDIQSEERFREAILNHWKGQLSGRTRGAFEEIKVADTQEVYRLNQHLKSPPEALVTLGSSLPWAGTDAALKDSVWLSLNFRLKKVGEDKELAKKEIKVEGGLILFDLSTNKPIAAADLASEQHVYRTDNTDSGIGMSLTNLIARMPGEQFATVASAAVRISAPSLYEIMIVQGDFNILDVNKIIEILNSKGIRFELKSRLLNMGASESKINVQAKADREQFQNLLRSLNGMELSSNKRLDYSPDNLLTLKVVSLFQQNSEQKAPEVVGEEEMPAEAI